MNTLKLCAKKISISIMLASVLIVFSCTNNPLSGATKISDILTSPSKYADSLVRVKGKVTESVIVFGQGYFIVADGTGAIAVVPAKTYPRTGEDVSIRGQVKNAFVLGDKSLTVIIESAQ